MRCCPLLSVLRPGSTRCVSFGTGRIGSQPWRTLRPTAHTTTTAQQWASTTARPRPADRLPSVVMVAYARTPIAKFNGSLSTLKGSELGSLAIRGALAQIPPSDQHKNEPQLLVREAFLGNVVSAGMGQAPARQAVLGAALPASTICTTVNKVCASGMKAVMLATQTLQLKALATEGHGQVGAILAGGFESMSQVPHYLTQGRAGFALGHTPPLLDGVIWDGLWDVYSNQHMGMCAEKCARDFQFSRTEQDDYARESYRRAQQAQQEGRFQEEMVPVTVPRPRRGQPALVTADEEPTAVQLDKMATLRPAFDPAQGTVTAANASSLNDGAAAIILMTEEEAVARNLRPLARILGYGDAAQDPVDFTTSPSLAVPVALQQAGLQLSDIEYHEINEAFAVVSLANIRLMNLDPTRVNVWGGAVALGHPIGMSGARILGTLYHILKHHDATLGCASICNGGGGASAVIIERLP